MRSVSIERPWVLAIVAVLLACGPGGLLTMASAQGAHRGGTLRAGLDADPPTLDPHLSGSAVDRQVYQNLYDKLVDTDANLAVVPMLATSWTISPDGKTVTFKLRQGVRFSDGTPFDADAVKYNFERMLDPKFPSVRRSEIRPVTGVSAPDASTVAISLEQPYSPLLYVLTDRAGMMVSPAAARAEGTNFTQHPVGTGPFVFVDRVPQDHITLRRNPTYWVKGQPYVDEVVFRPITDDNARVANLKSGDVDIINLVPLPQVKTLSQEAAQPGARFKVLGHGAMAWTALSLNVTKPPFDNKLLRQAFAATIDRDAIANVVLQGAAYPAYSLFPNGTAAYDPSWKLPPRNIAKAKELLQSAGHPGGFDFTLIILPGQERVALAQAIQAMAADAGIKVTIRAEEQGTFVSDVTKVQAQSAVIEWSGRPDPDFDIYPFVTKSGIGAFNYTGYTGDRMQTALDAARYLNDMGQRRRAYRQASEILADDVPYIPLFFPKEYKLVSTRLRGFVQVPDGMMRLRTVWLAP